VVIGVTIVAILLVLGTPFLHVNFGLPDDRVLPKSASSRQVQDQLRTNFSSQELAAMPVVGAGSGDPSTRTGEIATYASVLSKLAGVARVDAITGSYIGGRQVAPPNQASARFSAPTGTWLSVVPSVEPLSNPGEQLVKQVRAQPAPFPVQVGGSAAELVDSKASLFRLVPIAGLVIGVVTFVVLFLMAGSLLVPAKAVILNLLSLSATFGAMVWVFQEGHLSGLLNFTPTGLIDTTTPITMFCIAFGLSMDYEVFLLSRIKEEYDRTGDNTASVAVGLERTGRIVTAAAGLLSVVFIAFATSQITFIKLLGVGLALAVLMDATLIRGPLGPAFMRLAGRANWWAPAPLRRFHQRYGIREAEPAHEIQTEPAPLAAGDGALLPSAAKEA
jgi:RND superfamily putative drug exporter